ncbi:MAG TPA: hypothetical protein VHN78_10715 [Chloroflexota bacterium]|nr:hypothetical protein [Chloroflexota bacterium]
MAMTMTPTMTTSKSWLDHDLGTQTGAAVCAILPTGLLTGALWQQTGPAAATALALAFLALAVLLLAGVRKLAAA